MTAVKMMVRVLVIVMTAGFLVLSAPVAWADDSNCVDRGWGMRLCRNPDNSLTFCGAGIMASCRLLTPELLPMLGDGPLPAPAAGFK